MQFAQRLHFKYADRLSSEFKIFNVNENGGLQQEAFLAPRQIKETTIRGRKTPYFSEVTSEPYSFSLNLFFEDGFDDESLIQVKQWLSQSYYQPFYFLDKPEIIYYCLPVGEPQLKHNTSGQGYVSVDMRCNSSFAYSPFILSPIYTVNGSMQLEIMNFGTAELYPELWITKKNITGEVIIRNYSNGSGNDFRFLKIDNNETIYVNNELKQIETNIINEYRYDSFNNHYLYLVYGKNTLEIEGDCEVRMRYQYKYLLG